MKMHRRDFVVALGAAATAARAPKSLSATPDNPYDILIRGQYANDIQLVHQQTGKYFGVDFRPTDMPTTWALRLGRYVGRYNGKDVDLHGYWIFRKDANQCWQAVNYGNNRLDYWNKDGRRVGNPEDWELFSFEEVSRENRTVKIYATAYVSLRSSYPGQRPNPDGWSFYINIAREKFRCSAKKANAAVFTVRFPNEPHP